MTYSSLLSSCLNAPSFLDASFLKHSNQQIKIKYSQTIPNQVSKVTSSIVVENGISTNYSSCDSVVYQSYSPSGDYFLKIIKCPPPRKSASGLGDGPTPPHPPSSLHPPKPTSSKESSPAKENFNLQIFFKNRCIVSTHTHSFHEKILTGSLFGPIVWNEKLGKIAYTAQPIGCFPATTSKSHFYQISNESEDIDSNSVGEQFDFVMDWGEQLKGLVYTSIFTLSFPLDNNWVISSPDPVLVVSGIKDFSNSVFSGHSFGQPIFHNDKIICTMYMKDPRQYRERPGLIYCFQRESRIVQCDFFKKRYQIMNPIAKCFGYSTLCPRVSPNGKLFCTSRQVDGPEQYSSYTHNSGVDLILFDFPEFELNSDNLPDITTIETSTTISDHDNSSANYSIPKIQSVDIIHLEYVSKRNFDSNVGVQDFPGIYTHFLPSKIFINESNICIPSIWRTFEVLIVFQKDLSNIWRRKLVIGGHGNTFALENAEKMSWRLHDISENALLVSTSSIISPPIIYTLNFNNGEISTQISQIFSFQDSQFEPFNNSSSFFKACTGHILFIAPAQSKLISDNKFDDSGLSPLNSKILTETIAVFPPFEETPSPIVSILHGGPHSVYTNVYSHLYAFLLRLGKSIIFPAYRGSIGFGEQFLAALPGRIGRVDVLDCIKSHVVFAKTYSKEKKIILTNIKGTDLDDLSTYSSKNMISFSYNKSNIPRPVDPNDIHIMGGSHGGFLSCWLVVHPYSKKWVKTASIRNPVTNCASLFSTSDIPDWTLVESGLFDATTGLPRAKAVNSSCVKRLFDCSPVSLLGDSDISAAVLMAIGTDDRRVHPSQGYEFVQSLTNQRQIIDKSSALKVSNLLPQDLKIRMLVYPDNPHALDSVDASTDFWVNSMNWMETYSNQKEPFVSTQ